MVGLTFGLRFLLSRVHVNVCVLGEKFLAKQMKVAVPLSSSVWVGAVRSRDASFTFGTAKQTHISICSSNGQSRYCSLRLDCVATVYEGNKYASFKNHVKYNFLI